MSGLIYYIRGAINQPSEDLLVKSGLVGQVPDSVIPCHNFIDGSKGSTFSLHGKGKGSFRINFENSVQSWQDIPGTPLSIGYNIDNPPTPQDFMKPEIVPGHNLLLGDGNEYIIPIARRYQVGCLLPYDMLMLVHGKLQKVTIERYLELQQIAEKIAIWQGFMPGDKKDISFIDTDEKFFLVCCKVLATNYNLDYREISILKLFNNINIVKVLQYVVDLPYLDEVETNLKQLDETKKKR